MLTIESGKQAAKVLVNSNKKSYELASQTFGGLIDKYLGSAPRSLIISHILLVNPLLSLTPQPRGYTRGVFQVRIDDAREYEIEWEKLEDPEVNAYVWSRALNDSAHYLYTTYPDYFPKTEEDFWKCTYLRQHLSPPMFDTLWQESTLSKLDADNIYTKLQESVESRKRSLLGMPVAELRKIVFLNVEYVFQFAQSQRMLQSTTSGIEPTPSSRVIGKLFAPDNVAVNKSYENRAR